MIGNKKYLEKMTTFIDLKDFQSYFKQVKVIGHGGTSTVILFKDMRDNEKYAVKIMPKKDRSSHQNEVSLQNSLCHNSIVKLFGSLEDDSI